MGRTNLSGPVNSDAGFMVNGIAIAGVTTTALADNTGGAAGVALVAATLTAPTLTVDVTGADTVAKAAVNANFTAIQTALNSISTQIAKLNDNMATLRAILATAGVVA